MSHITQKFAKHFAHMANANDTEDWDKVVELQQAERALLDNSSPEEQYEYYLRVAHDHTSVALEKIDRAVAHLCLSNDIEVKTHHLSKKILKNIDKLIGKEIQAKANLDEVIADFTAIFEQDLKPLPDGYITPPHYNIC